jgi:hypothetical protein
LKLNNNKLDEEKENKKETYLSKIII